MTVPILVLMLITMVSAMTAAIRDQATHAAVVDIAELRVEQAADAVIESCLSEAGCVLPAGAKACANSAGIAITIEVDWNPRLWHNLSTVTATRVITHKAGLEQPALTNRLRDMAGTC